MSSIISISADNIDDEHICCAIGNDRANKARAAAKKAWLKERFADGLVFKRLDERGKVFIEYMPVESCWKPVDGKNWMMINCLWVSGKFKGQGWSSRLLEECLSDAREQGMDGVLYVTSRKKEHYLTDKKFFVHKGFKAIDDAPPHFELLAYPFGDTAEKPRFSSSVMEEERDQETDFRFVYADQCPHVAEYVHIMADYAREKGYTAEVVKLESAAQARKEGSPFGTFGAWYRGRLVSHSPMTEKMFDKLLGKISPS